MLDHLRSGMKIRARGPAGIFTIPMRGDGKYLFISAGTGITPSLSMTNYLYDRGLDQDIVLINCVRRPAEIICRRRLELMASRVPSIKLHFIVEQEDPYDVWTGYRGRLNQLMLGLIASDYLERKVYCCGPEPFMQAVRDMLIALGYDMEQLPPGELRPRRRDRGRRARCSTISSPTRPSPPRSSSPTRA